MAQKKKPAPPGVDERDKKIEALQRELSTLERLYDDMKEEKLKWADIAGLQEKLLDAVGAALDPGGGGYISHALGREKKLIWAAYPTKVAKLIQERDSAIETRDLYYKDLMRILRVLAKDQTLESPEAPIR